MKALESTTVTIEVESSDLAVASIMCELEHKTGKQCEIVSTH